MSPRILIAGLIINRDSVAPDERLFIPDHPASPDNEPFDDGQV
jgi:hypothetical protein